MNQPKPQPFTRPTRLDDFPVGTCFSAGHLVETNASWRSATPKIDVERCTGCQLCYLLCPEGVVFKLKDSVGIDYDFCKGCGICARHCKAKAIQMIREGVR